MDGWDTTTRTSRKYPNPGYLGISSHVAIFDHLPDGVNNESIEDSPSRGVHSHGRSDSSADDVDVYFGSQLLEKIYRAVPILAWIDLVEAWLATGVNMAMAGPFVESCTLAVKETFDKFGTDASRATVSSRVLSINSSQTPSVTRSLTLEEFCDSTCRSRVRWEAIGLFFTAVGRATNDMTSFQPLYTTKQKRQNIQRLAMRFADDCLNLSLSLDAMNDLLLIFQFENFVNHTHVDGDQSR